MVWLTLAGLGLLLLLTVLVGSRAELPLPKLSVPQGETVGGRGPIGLTFSQRMQPGTVHSRLRFEPPLAGRFAWEERTLWFYPLTPLQPGWRYTLHLDAGSTSEDGRTIRRSASWTLAVRQPWVVYLAPLTVAAELWRSTPDGNLVERLTDTGGRVFDYAVSFDGALIAFSATNEQGGSDLWLVNRQGNDQRRVLDCGTDWCTAPAWAPDNRQIAFERGSVSPLMTELPAGRRIWLYDRRTEQATPFYVDDEWNGSDPSWSPDGRRLAFYDLEAGGIRVVALASGRELLLPSNQPQTGRWSPDGGRMVFTHESLVFGEQMYVRPYLVDFEYPRSEHESENVRSLFGVEAAPVDYSLPEWSPDGEWLLCGLRVTGMGLNRQLWLISLDGNQAQAITDLPSYTHAAYRWDASGQAIAFQRLQVGSSQAKPEVAVWWQDQGEVVVLAQDAGMPEWLP